MLNLEELEVALVPKETEAANLDLEEERTEGQTAAATPQLITALEAILDEEREAIGMDGERWRCRGYKYMGKKDLARLIRMLIVIG